MNKSVSTRQHETHPSSKGEGGRVPEVIFHLRVDEDWFDLSSKDIFKGRRTIVFALPGAFTPTCSATHLPGYLALAEKIKAQGIDDIYCLSVNDAFVMNAWAKDQGVDGKVGVIPDGSGHFSEEMGLLVDKDHLGFGMRSWRYSMVVDDGIVEKIFLEDFNDKGDPFKVSDAYTMLEYLKSR